ncbi:MAG: ankyrin repeat domain-containing protein [Acidiferrobacterales bacterium]
MAETASVPRTSIAATSSTMAGQTTIGSAEAMWTAAKSGDVDTVQHLLRKSVDVNAADANGWTALMFAAKQGNREIVRILLSAGANIDAKANDGSSALIIATGAGHTQVVAALIEAGTEVSARNGAGLTALNVALEKGHREIEGLLVSRIRALNKRVAEVQRLLTELGYNPGPADGLFGRRTAAAIRAYQREVGLRVDGIVSDALVEHARTSVEQRRLAEQPEAPDEKKQTGQGG